MPQSYAVLNSKMIFYTVKGGIDSPGFFRVISEAVVKVAVAAKHSALLGTEEYIVPKMKYWVRTFHHKST